MAKLKQPPSFVIFVYVIIWIGVLRPTQEYFHCQHIDLINAWQVETLKQSFSLQDGEQKYRILYLYLVAVKEVRALRMPSYLSM